MLIVGLDCRIYTALRRACRFHNPLGCSDMILTVSVIGLGYRICPALV
jgi:hypothetical protein